MAMNLKDPEVERLAAEIAAMTGESKTRAVRKALQERRQRLSFQIAPRDRKREWRRFLEREIWPTIPKKARGRRLSKREEAAILGYGREGF